MMCAQVHYHYLLSLSHDYLTTPHKHRILVYLQGVQGEAEGQQRRE